MNDEFIGRQGDTVNRISLIKQAQFPTGVTVELEKALVARLEPGRHPRLTTAVPHDFRDGIALAEGVGQVCLQLPKLGRAHQFA